MLIQLEAILSGLLTGKFNMNKQQQLKNAVLEVVKSLSELHMLIDKDSFMLNMFNNSVMTTGAMPCSLDKFIGEWQTVLNHIELDRESLYECWYKSAKFYRELTMQQKADFGIIDAGVESNDIVFENGSYITCGLIQTHVGQVGDYEIRYYVKIGRDCQRFATFKEAAKYLWENHAKESYGV